MSTSTRLSRWALALALTVSTVSAAAASSLTLDTPPGINHFVASNHLISGAPVNAVTPQVAAFEAFHHSDVNDDGVWNGPDARRAASGTYANGLFGLYSMCQSLGGFSAAHQYVSTRGRLIIDDMIVSSDEASPPATVPTSLSFHVSGGTSHFTNPNKGEVLTLTLYMHTSINGNVFNGEYSWSKYRTSVSETVTGLGTQIAGGSFSDVFNATITTGLVNVPVNTPFRVEMDFVVSAGAGGGAFGSYGGVIFDATNTAGFLPGAAIFNDLPAGYTATSPDVGIENNMFVGSPVAVEPTTWGGIKSLFSPSNR